MYYMDRIVALVDWHSDYRTSCPGLDIAAIRQAPAVVARAHKPSTAASKFYSLPCPVSGFTAHTIPAPYSEVGDTSPNTEMRNASNPQKHQPRRLYPRTFKV
jgi:hypothetical protein